MARYRHFLNVARDAVLALLLVPIPLVVPVADTVAQGLPLPRFVSLRAEKANVRTGPGVRYPVEWVYVRKSLPLEITAEFEHWRKIRDWEGTEGWVHRNLLSGRRTVMVMGGVRALRRDPAEGASIAARLESGVVGDVLSCSGNWCRIAAGSHKGYIPRAQLWGVYPQEKIE